MAHARGKPVDDLTGQYFGGYKLEELVGTGGMASIYKGFDETLSRWVAIKVVPGSLSPGSPGNCCAASSQYFNYL